MKSFFITCMIISK